MSIMCAAKKSFLLFFLFIRCLAAINAEVFIEEVAGSGISIRTAPADAKVYIDGIERGKTPLLLNDLVAGTHTILIRKDYYENWFTEITFPQEGRLNVFVDLALAKGQINISFTNNGTGAAIKPNDAEIYVDNRQQSRTADSDGIVLLLPEGQKLITARVFGYQEAKKTVLVEKGRIINLVFELSPAALNLSGVNINRKVFNPQNEGALGSATLHFTINAPGFGKLSVLDEQGGLVNECFFGDNFDTTQAKPFSAWTQEVIWDGKNKAGSIVPEGVYTLRLTAAQSKLSEGSGAGALTASKEVRVDYSAEIIPLSLLRGKPGLLNAAFSRTLPQGSFQIESALLAGDFAADKAAFSSLPFAAGFRFTPVKSFETSFAAHISPEFDKNPAKVTAGVAAGIKKEYRRSKAWFPGFSLGFSYGWINGKSKTEAGMAAGAGINAAFDWELPGGFALLCSPALLWTGEHGFPAEAAPHLEAGGGILWRRTFFVAGISAGLDYGFAGFAQGLQPLVLGAEFYFYPPPSNFVFGFLTKCKIENGAAHISGGLSMGIIF